MIAEQLGEPRPSREEIELRLNPKPQAVPIPIHFVPSVGPVV
jgi:hypothetical protein